MAKKALVIIFVLVLGASAAFAGSRSDDDRFLFPERGLAVPGETLPTATNLLLSLTSSMRALTDVMRGSRFPIHSREIVDIMNEISAEVAEVARLVETGDSFVQPADVMRVRLMIEDTQRRLDMLLMR